MPAATHYHAHDRQYRYAAEQERRQRTALHAHHLAYLTNQTPKPLEPLGAFDDNIRVPIAAIAVRETIAFAFPDFPSLQIDPYQETPLESLLRRLWLAQGVPAALLQQMALNGALDGQVFVRVLPPLGRGGLPEIRLLRGDSLLIWWDADDRARILWYELQWEVGRVRYRQDIVAQHDAQGAVTAWQLLDFQLKGSRWEPLGQTAWPYALGPLVTWQHLPVSDDVYGEHEFTHAALNDQINYLASNLMRILRFHAHPRTVGIGFEAEALQATSVDGFWTVANEKAQLFNLEMHNDLQSSMRFLEWLTAQYQRAAQVVSVTGDVASFQGVTNLGLRVAFLPMLQKTEVLHRQYGRGLEALSQRLLMLAGVPYYAVNVTCQWGSALPVDRREDVELVERQVALGVMSPRTAAAVLGLDFEREQETGGGEAAPPL